MSGNLDDFLKQAAERRRNRDVPSQDASRRQPVDSIVQADIVHEVSGDDVAEYVKEHLDSSHFDQSASRLGETVDQADEKIEEHLHDVFDHKLGSLRGLSSLESEEGGSTKQDDAAVSDGKKSIIDLFRSPSSIRDAIVLSEILNRPEHRW